MRQATLFDPRFIAHMSTVSNGFMIAYGEVYDATGEQTTWTPGVGNADNGLVLKWKGNLRAQPNIDWRARTRNNNGEFNATMDTRFNLPFNKNEYGAVLDTKGDVITYGDDPVFSLGDVIYVTRVSGPSQETLMRKRHTVRNALSSTTMWQWDLLANSETLSRNA